jgi:hypothetical protein
MDGAAAGMFGTRSVPRGCLGLTIPCLAVNVMKSSYDMLIGAG